MESVALVVIAVAILTPDSHVPHWT